MKKSLLLSSNICAFILMLLIGSCGSGDTEKAETSVKENPDAKEAVVADAPEEFGKKVTELIIANDYQGLANLIITKEEMTKAISGSNAPANGKEFAISRVEEEIKEMQTDVKTGLDEIRSAGTAAGIVWETAKFKEARPAINDARGFQMLLLKCVIESNGTDHVITITDVVGTDNGWKLGGKMMFGDLNIK